MIEVTRAGLVTTVQDLGRHGWRHLGIATGGALDTLALEVGNRLVGNPPQAAGLEVTMGPAILRFTVATRVAVTGAESGATLDGKPVYAWWSVPVSAGQELVLHAATRSMRVYLCVAGGIDVLPMLGSRSTDLGARFGGLGGRALSDGDRLPLGNRCASAASVALDAPEFGVKAPTWCHFGLEREPLRRGKHEPGAQWAVPIRVLCGAQYDSFTDSAQHAFWTDEWTVTPNSNRMGYRLAGTQLVRAQHDDLLSHAVVPGTIQVPPNGQPIVLMHDAQTTGGYPKIGVVIRADLWKLAQVRLNRNIRFIRATQEEAHYALNEERAYLRQIEAAIAMHAERLHNTTRAA